VKAKRIGAVLGLTLGLPALGCIVGYLLGNVVRAATVVHWEPLGTPPEPAVAFAGIVQEWPDYVVYVQSGSGLLYASRGRELDSWGRGEAQSPWHSRECGSVEPHFAIPAPPAGVVDCIEYSPGFESMTWEDRRFVLLDDGTVWTWQRGEGILTIREIYAVRGLGVGLVAGIIGAIVVFTRKKGGTRPGEAS
jgi:hypothetical protein